MFPNPQSVVFGKAPIKTRASFSFVPKSIEDFDVGKSPFPNDNSGSKLHSKLNSEDRLRLVQLEIAQKEACNVLRSICEESSKEFGVSLEPEAEITDFLTGILILGNLCNRIGREKFETEKTLDHVRASMNELKKSETEVISQLESSISNLQHENMKLSDMLSELTVKQSQKINLLSKEDTVESLKLEKESLGTKLQHSERKLMEIPRLEEAVLRDAKSKIRQQEITNTKSKLEAKKSGEEITSLNFWKNKAKVLEERNRYLQIENQKLVAQTRIAHSKYAYVAAAVQRCKNRDTRKAGNVNGYSRISTVAISEGENVYTTYTADRSHANEKTSMSKKMLQMNSEEMLRLKSENSEKSKKILNLSQKLSTARAYPLLAVENKYDADLVDEPQSPYTINRTKVTQTSMKPEVQEIDGMHDELESVSSHFMREENLLQEQRVKSALIMQAELHENHQKRINGLPKHISAIRNSKSFSEYLDEVESKSN